MKNTRKLTVAGGIAAASLTAPLLMAVSAEASTIEDGCEVNPHRPVYSGRNNANNIPLVDYKVTVTCDPGRSVYIEQERWESDLVAVEGPGEGGDDHTGSSTKTLDFTAAGGTETFKFRRALPDTGPATEGPIEEVYQAVRFEVTTDSGVDGGMTDYELTAARSIHR